MTIDPVVCEACGMDDCQGECRIPRQPACGPCAQCGDPCDPGESLCHACKREEAAA